MTAGPEHDQVAELLGAYALDAVDADECRRVEQHLAECPRCLAELDGLRQSAADLALLSVPDDEHPPAAVWDRIAAGIGVSETPAAPNVVGIEAAPAGRGRAGARWRLAHRKAWLGGVAAAAAVIAALAVSLVHTDGQVHRLQSALAQGGSQAAVHAALTSPGHRVVDLRSSGGARLAEVVVRRDGQGFVVHSEMSRLPVTETYQLWASINGRPISLGLLGRRPAPGTAFSLGTSATGARKLMVTVEPAGGVPTPDTTPIATAPLSLT